MSSVHMPNPAAVPPSPMADDEAARQRKIASDTAMAEARATGRASTIVGGAVVAGADQARKLKARASSDLGL